MGLRRAPAPNLAQRILLILEFAGVALLLLFHFFQDEQAYTLGFAIATWPVMIVIAVVLAVLAIVQLAKPTAPTAQPVPSP